MKIVYHADHSVDAHIVKNLLESEGVCAHVRGEFLQGGIGDLQTVGLVHVMVEDEDYEQARALVLDWESARPEVDDENEQDMEHNRSAMTPPPARRGWFLPALLGLLVGIGGTSYYFRTPVSYDGIDYDGDGRLDVRWTYHRDLISKSEADWNRDGKFDLVEIYDHYGLIESSTADINFDGIFDTESRFSEGLPIWQKTDTTGDGFKDFLTYFAHGNIERTVNISPASKLPVKVQHFNERRMVSAELDTDGDGKLDTVHEYDEIGEISSSRPK